MKKAWRPREVKVFWTDAYETHKITGTRDQVIAEAKLVPRETKGFLVFNDEERVILSRHYDPPDRPGDEPEVDSIIVIPTVLVKAIKPNGEKRKAKIMETRTLAREESDGDKA